MGQNQGKESNNKPPPSSSGEAGGGEEETTTPILMSSFENKEPGAGESEIDEDNNDPYKLHSLAHLGYIDDIREALLADDFTGESLVRQLDTVAMVPAHHAALSGGRDKTEIVRLFIKHDLDDARSSGLDPFVNLVDVRGNTLLHYACLSTSPDLVKALVEEYHADPNLLNLEGLSPLHVAAKQAYSEAAITCAEVLLKCPSLVTFAPTSGGATAVHLAAGVAADKMLKTLIRAGFEPAVLDDMGNSPLHLAASSGDSQEAVNCVQELLRVASPTMINAKNSMETGQTALHIASYRSHPRVLGALLESPNVDVWVEDGNHRTALHCAVEAWFRPRSLDCVKLLVESKKVDDWLDKARFIFGPNDGTSTMRDDSPMDLALKHKSIRIAEYLLQSHPTPAAWLDERMLERIYTCLPEALLPLLNTKGIFYKPSLFHERNECVDVEFGFVTGFRDLVDDTNESPSRPESGHLHHILSSPKDIQATFLLHPLTQVFIERKWDKIKHLTWISILFQFVWLLLYTILVYELYVPDCPIPKPDPQDYVEVSKKKAPRFWLSLAFASKEDSTIADCVFDRVVSKGVVVTLYLLSGLILVKEAFQFKHNSNYLREVANWAQITLLVIFLVNSWPAWTSYEEGSGPSKWQIYLASLGIFMAWVLSLREISKFPSCGIYSAILKKVFWHCLKMLVFYIPLLIAFGLALRLLLPGKGQYSYLLFAVVKVVVMMTGELDFEDSFYDEDGPKLALNFILGQLVTLLLVFITTIVLLNLLTGLAVNDVKSLIEEADIHRLGNELRQIYLLEVFVLELRAKAGRSDCLTRFVHRLNLTSVVTPDFTFFASKALDVETKSYSADLKKRIKEAMVPDEEDGEEDK